MIFKDPYSLLLLLPLAVLAIAGAKAGISAPSIRFPAGESAGESPRSPLMRGFLLWCRVLAAALLIIALARPQKTGKSEIPPSAGIDIMLCLDTSYSMAAVDFKPSRLEAAKEAAADFIKKRPNDRIGLVVFGGSAVMACPLTLDHEALLERLKSTYVNMVDRKGTAIGDGIMTAINHIKDSKAKSKVIILLTDGRSNAGLIQDPVYAAGTAKPFGIKIYAIGTAKKGRSMVPTGDPFMPYAYLDDDLDEGTLMAIASSTGGKFYRAQNRKELEKIYSEINSMEKTKFKNKMFATYEDLYEYPLFAGLFLIIFVFIFENLIFVRI